MEMSFIWSFDTIVQVSLGKFQIEAKNNKYISIIIKTNAGSYIRHVFVPSGIDGYEVMPLFLSFYWWLERVC